MLTAGAPPPIFSSVGMVTPTCLSRLPSEWMSNAGKAGYSARSPLAEEARTGEDSDDSDLPRLSMSWNPTPQPTLEAWSLGRDPDHISGSPRNSWRPIGHGTVTPHSIEPASPTSDRENRDGLGFSKRSRGSVGDFVRSSLTPRDTPGSSHSMATRAHGMDDRIILRTRPVHRTGSSMMDSSGASVSGMGGGIDGGGGGGGSSRVLVGKQPSRRWKTVDSEDKEEEETARRDGQGSLGLSSTISVSSDGSNSCQKTCPVRNDSLSKFSPRASRLRKELAWLSASNIIKSPSPIRFLQLNPARSESRVAPRIIGLRNRMSAGRKGCAAASSTVEYVELPESDDDSDSATTIPDKQVSGILVKPGDHGKQGKARFILCADLSNEQELYPIRVWNDVNEEKLPKFIYIPGLEDEPGYIRTPCICQCQDGCDDVRCHCMTEPYDPKTTQFPYDETTGLLLHPRRWLTSQNVIWECSPQCPCGDDCPSRSAQKGLRYPYEVFMTKEKGWGVRPLRDLPAGAFVAEYAGVVKEDFNESTWQSNWYTFTLTDVRVVCAAEDGRNFYIDAREKGNMTRFINHGCNPNLCPVHVYYDDCTPNRGVHIGFYTAKAIKAYEELTLDYSNEYWKAMIAKGKYCKCHWPKCRYKATAFARSTDSTSRNKKLDYSEGFWAGKKDFETGEARYCKCGDKKCRYKRGRKGPGGIAGGGGAGAVGSSKRKKSAGRAR